VSFDGVRELPTDAIIILPLTGTKIARPDLRLVACIAVSDNLPRLMHPEQVTSLKIVAVAIAIGLDVFAISVGVGITKAEWSTRIRLGAAFAAAEITMQVVGYELGTGAGKLFGEIAEWIGFGLLALVGVFMIRESYSLAAKPAFDLTRGVGLLITSLSISLDSLGVGFALPAINIPLLPMLITVSVTTSVFTFVGLAFGQRIGERYEHEAQRVAGAMLVLLAVLFSIQHLIPHLH
jgi:putative Mn2+ efflux pump MntP